MKKVQRNEEEIIVKNTWIFNVVHLYQERKTRRSDLKNKQGTQDKDDVLCFPNMLNFNFFEYMKNFNVVITDWKNGDVVNHIQQLTRKEFKKFTTGKYHIYELGGYKKHNGKIEYEIPKFYWAIRPSIGTFQTYPYTNEVMRTAIESFRTLEAMKS